MFADGKEKMRDKQAYETMRAHFDTRVRTDVLGPMWAPREQIAKWLAKAARKAKKAVAKKSKPSCKKNKQACGAEKERKKLAAGGRALIAAEERKRKKLITAEERKRKELIAAE